MNIQTILNIQTMLSFVQL